MKNIRSQKGAIAAVVLVSMLLFVIVLGGTYMINANVKKAQLKSQIILRDEYSRSMTDEEKDRIYYNLTGVNLEETE